MSESLSRNPLPLDEGKRVVVEYSEESSSSDSEMEKITLAEINEREHNTETSSRCVKKSAKHTEQISYAELRKTLEKINKSSSARAGNSNTTEQEERWADLRRRERLLEQRESDWLKKQEATLGVRLKEFDEALQRRREEFDREKADFNEAKLEFKEAKLEFKREMAEFRISRDELLRENTEFKVMDSMRQRLFSIQNMPDDVPESHPRSLQYSSQD
ncbi:hypothetical protein BGZ72_010616 [Mortierella alpina]|nr:hypothetical protein BGZ72_010616 [Mortierella alpina]